MGELALLLDVLEEFRAETREILAEELGGEPDDYRADRYRELQADGGDE